MTLTRTIPSLHDTGHRSGRMNIFHVLAAALFITCLFAGVAQAAKPIMVSGSSEGPWDGSWNTSFGSGQEPVGGTLTLYQADSVVTGIQDNGTVIASANGSTLSGTWFDSSRIGHEIGVFRLVLYEDTGSFTGTWAPITEGTTALGNSTRFWNGVRV